MRASRGHAVQISSFFAPTTPAPKAATGGLAVAKPSAEEEFLAFAAKTPAEQMREKILKSMGLTEDDLKGMDPKARKAVEDKIKEFIKAQLGEDARKGSLLDMQA
jgi:hypothetical protein